MVLDVKIEETLKLHFPDLKGSAFDDAVAVSNAFSQGTKCKQIQLGLAQLTGDMVGEYRVGEALRRQEKQAEINIDVYGNTVVPTVLRPLTDEEGHALLQAGKIWKDPGIDAGAGGHGEHTHRIQWYILTSQKIISKKPSDFLLEISKHRVPDTPQGGLWDCLFDRLKEYRPHEPPFGSNGEDDFRCPENLNKHATGLGNDLSKALQRRSGKRDDAKGLHADPKFQSALIDALYKGLGIKNRAQNDPVVQAKIKFTQTLGGKFDKNAVNRLFTAAVDYALQKQRLAVDEKSKTLVGIDKRDINVRVTKALNDAVMGHLERR